MLLAYTLRLLPDQSLCVDVCSVDIAQGKPLRSTTYPHQPQNLLKAAPTGVRVLPLDQRILLTMNMHQGHKSWECRFQGKDARAILDLLVESGRAYAWCHPDHPLHFGENAEAEPIWFATEQGSKAMLRETGGRENRIFLPCVPPVLLDPKHGSLHAVDCGMPPELANAWMRAGTLADEACEAFIVRMAERFPSHPLPLPPAMSGEKDETHVPVPVVHVVTWDGREGPGLRVRLRFRYGTREIEAAAPYERVRFVRADGTVVDARRNREVEASAAQRLAAAGFVAEEVSAQDLFTRAAQEECLRLVETTGVSWDRILSQRFPEWAATGWDIAYAKGMVVETARDEDWYADFEGSGKGWMRYESGVTVQGERVNLLPFVRDFLGSRRSWPLDRIAADLEGNTLTVPTARGILLLPGERLLRMVRNLFELFGSGSLDAGKRLRVNLWRAAELAEDEPSANWRPPQSLVDTVRQLRGALDVAPVTPPETFLGELRPYQAQGVGWLRFLRQHQLGGILADDMGLGKTVQVISALLDARERGELDKPVLIAAPTSVLPNWKKELERFAPSLRVHVLHGARRHETLDAACQAEVLLTSHALLRQDADWHAERALSLLVLDEAQAIKNPASRLAKACKRIDAYCRLALTGTPCENHLGDLWSLMDFAQPGFLGSESDFKEQFRQPIEIENCRVAREALIRRLRPLMLRRTKDVVASELPPKTVIVQTIPLSEAQTDLYQTVRMAMSAKIEEEMKAKGLERSRIVVLDAMLKLRQICCDPRLRDDRGDHKIPEDSCKLEWLLEVLPELLEEGRRILLFSQFTTMLDLIKEQLVARGLAFVEIRGSTQDRETPVQRFQAGEVPLFLISLKSGGFGLNLTAADTVIHYDPWWNPAAEEQATDRAHRIGQDKPVFVYKLVTQGTIEARILEMQEHKKRVTNLSDTEAGTGGLAYSEADLRYLLSPIGGS